MKLRKKKKSCEPWEKPFVIRWDRASADHLRWLKTNLVKLRKLPPNPPLAAVVKLAIAMTRYAYDDAAAHRPVSGPPAPVKLSNPA